MPNNLEFTSDILGENFVAHTFDLGPDPDREPGGNVVATLVKHTIANEPHHAVLWVHGFSDYFFNPEIAEFFTSRGYAFYALDLRKSGRSLRDGQSPHYATDFAVYNEELDLAVDAIAADHPGMGIVIAAHSTGGLITPLWLDRRRRRNCTAPIVGQVLDSPWFDMPGPSMLWAVGVPLIKLIGRIAGTRVAPAEQSSVHGLTVHRGHHGDFDYDLALKPINGFPLRFGWLRAVTVAHSKLHRGLDTGVPSLVLRSARSLSVKEYSIEASRADLILDTEHMAKWAGALGNRVAVVPISDARHGVFVSEREARDTAYGELASWLSHEIEHQTV
ncbi:alpha/beta hydrolase [Gordonia sp. HY285]|uniref:alpha/beta hydrolase n=1 Tax=Gordonia liuliyuniae TaxID=2911517 RepID=UPI001F20E763|nr:alpha/beta hydrolase [Gordonia liuliyuniae]MCF8608917.1 alpha/beta hydrolase [Gordonia liuliyuniae]